MNGGWGLSRRGWFGVAAGVWWGGVDVEALKRMHSEGRRKLAR